VDPGVNGYNEETIMSDTPEWATIKINEAFDKQLRVLNLSCERNTPDSQKLTSIPLEVFELDQLEALDLSYNRISTVPEAIEKLRKLLRLDLSENCLTDLPDSICRLENLVSLNLKHNRLTTLSESITWLKSLRSLDLSQNLLTSIPYVIGRLKDLGILNLSNNQLADLPENIGGAQNLTVLNLRGNCLSQLPETIGQLQNLTELYLDGNQLTDLPDSTSLLQILIGLHISDNRYSILPNVICHLKNLRVLDLSSNRLTALPEMMAQLPFLTVLSLNGNPLESPPPEVVRGGALAVKDYLRQIEARGKDFLYEAKLLIVGEAGAGKTTLAKKIQNADYQLREDEDTTRGIDVIHWHFTLNNGRDFQVNIWDFGGQEIYHATHQFFLTRRSLYALVADTRKEDTDFYYWLNVVELLSENSPLLIVKNEKQDRHREINDLALRGQFTNLKDTLATNLATNRGLPKILDEIKYYILQLPHVGAALPKTWIRVREALEEDPRNYISLEEYLDICEHNGFKEEIDKIQLSSYLHDLGVCLHFQDDPLLRKTVFLKPHWGTNAVYKVLDNPTVVRNRGLFTRLDLEKIWDEPEYSGMHNELIQLMTKFRLCYQIPGTIDEFIAPQLLTDNPHSYEWDSSDNLFLRYKYEFMPKGILNQFIVAMHRQIADHSIVWKSGVVLEKVFGVGDISRAEIIEIYNKREIRIRVAGKHKKELLAIVTFALDNIHESYHRLKYSKLIPCNCTICKDSPEPYFYYLEMLQKFSEDRQFYIQCTKSYEMVDVRTLVEDGVGREEPEPDVLPPSQVIFGPVSQVFVHDIINGDATANQIHITEEIMPKKSQETIEPKSPWISGSFYLAVVVIVMATLGVLTKFISPFVLPIVLVAGVIFVILINAFQLRQDKRLSEKSFLELVKMTLGQLPLIGRIFRKPPKGK